MGNGDTMTCLMVILAPTTAYYLMTKIMDYINNSRTCYHYKIIHLSILINTMA